MSHRPFHLNLDLGLQERLRTAAAAHGVTVTALVNAMLANGEITDETLADARAIMTKRLIRSQA